MCWRCFLGISWKTIKNKRICKKCGRLQQLYIGGDMDPPIWIDIDVAPSYYDDFKYVLVDEKGES